MIPLRLSTFFKWLLLRLSTLTVLIPFRPSTFYSWLFYSQSYLIVVIRLRPSTFSNLLLLRISLLIIVISLSSSIFFSPLSFSPISFLFPVITSSANFSTSFSSLYLIGCCLGSIFLGDNFKRAVSSYFYFFSKSSSFSFFNSYSRVFCNSLKRS